MTGSAPGAVRSVGRSALLVDTAGHDPATFAAHLAEAAADQGTIPADVVVGAETVLVIAGSRPSLDALAEVLAGLTSEAVRQADRAREANEIEIPVRYDGPDLDSVAATVGLSTSEVKALHGDASYRAAFMGFAPGFAYLAGLPSELVTGRRSQPRSTVPAGSVAIADVWSAVYPRSTPGGWHLLGTTDTLLFDPERRPPSLLAAGDRVRFVSRGGSRPVPSAPSPAGPSPDGDVVLEVIEPGPLTTVQDRGRTGYAADGVPPSGFADEPSATLANRLVGNDAGAAVLETTMAGPKLRLAGRAARGRTVAVTGAVVSVAVDGVGRGQNAPFDVHPGQVVEIGSATAGLRSYVAVSGGLAVAAVLGSRSTDLLSGIGPTALVAGDLVAVGADEGRRPGVDVAPVAPLVPQGDSPAVIRVRLGPRADWLSDEGRRLLLAAPWAVDPTSNRVGVRLRGPDLERSHEGELAPEGLVTGAIQLTPAGELVVFGPDHPVTGGYPVVAVVDDADLAGVAQLRPGDTVTLRVTG